MKHEIVSSSFISTVGYDPIAKQLEVKFSSGRSAIHENITPEQHKALMAANSVGQHYNSHIKGSSSSVPAVATSPVAKTNSFKR